MAERCPRCYAATSVYSYLDGWPEEWAYRYRLCVMCGWRAANPNEAIEATRQALRERELDRRLYDPESEGMRLLRQVNRRYWEELDAKS